MDSRAKALNESGDRLFSEKQPLESFHQHVAEQFYPERAWFISPRTLGAEFADHLTTSIPLLARRELGNAFSTMLRPRGKDWYRVGTDREEREDYAAKRWLESRGKIMHRAMYDIRSQFVRSTNGGDHDFAAFGYAALSLDMNESYTGLQYGLYHPKDLAWAEGGDGFPDEIHRRWSCAPARQLVKKFPKTVPPKIREAAEKGTGATFNVRHAVVRAENYDTGSKWKQPWVSVWYDCEHNSILEEAGRWDPYYIIPRWLLLSGSQYPFSPATVVALPEGRMIQTQTLTLLEAGEKAVDPPMLARSEVIRGDAQLFAGGLTWVDQEYDSRLGKALEAAGDFGRGLPYGLEMLDRTRQVINQCFFLDKLNLPQNSGKTAYEVSQLVQEYIRNAIPLFEPMESEYNGQICERTFDLMLRTGFFGAREDIPQSIRGANIKFQFESPLHDAVSMQKAQSFLQAKSLLEQAVALDPSSRHILNARAAVRDSLDATVPQEWLVSEEDVEALAAQDAQQQEINQTMATVGNAAGVAEQVGRADQAMNAEGMA